jgi:hypothetical protein
LLATGHHQHAAAMNADAPPATTIVPMETATDPIRTLL